MDFLRKDEVKIFKNVFYKEVLNIFYSFVLNLDKWKMYQSSFWMSFFGGFNGFIENDIISEFSGLYDFSEELRTAFSDNIGKSFFNAWSNVRDLWKKIITM